MGLKSEGQKLCFPRQKDGCVKHYRKMAKKWIHFDKKGRWDTAAQLPTVVAMTGALVVIAIVIRSLYLMYIKPETA